MLLIVPGRFSAISNPGVALGLEALRQLIGEFDRILGEPLAVFDKPVHINAHEKQWSLWRSAKTPLS